MAADGVRHDKVSLEAYFKSARAKDESITLCKVFRLGTLGSNSTEMLQGHSAAKKINSFSSTEEDG